MHRGPSENKKLNCLRWKISYLCNLSLGFACYIFNLIVTRLLTRNNKQENKRISPDWWNHDNLLNLYTVLMFLHVASLRLFQLNFLSLSCLNEVLVPLPVMMCCSPQKSPWKSGSDILRLLHISTLDASTVCIHVSCLHLVLETGLVTVSVARSEVVDVPWRVGVCLDALSVTGRCRLQPLLHLSSSTATPTSSE